jgi:hypothetical protein
VNRRVKMITTGTLVIVALTGAQGGCVPHPSGAQNKASYWLKVDAFKFGKLVRPEDQFRYNVQMTITSKCYPLGAQVIDVGTDAGSWGHQVNIADDCNDPVKIELRASRHPANVGDGLQCSVTPTTSNNEIANPLVAEGKQRAVPGGPNIIVVNCTTTVNN